MQNFYSDKDRIVTDAIDGLITSYGGRVSRFKDDSYARVVVRTDLPIPDARTAKGFDAHPTLCIVIK